MPPNTASPTAQTIRTLASHAKEPPLPPLPERVRRWPIVELPTAALAIARRYCRRQQEKSQAIAATAAARNATSAQSTWLDAVAVQLPSRKVLSSPDNARCASPRCPMLTSLRRSCPRMTARRRDEPARRQLPPPHLPRAPPSSRPPQQAGKPASAVSAAAPRSCDAACWPGSSLQIATGFVGYGFGRWKLTLVWGFVF